MTRAGFTGNLSLAMRRRAAAGLTVVGLLLPVGWAVLMADAGASATRLKLSSGQAWLASPSQGLVTLIDGPSEQVVTRVAARSSEGTTATVVQQGESAFVADGATGTITRIDGATLLPSNPVAFGGENSKLTVVASESTAYVIDASTRMAFVIDPQTLQVERKLPMAARPGPQQMMLSSSGRLWAVDADGSGLNWYDLDGTQGRVAADPSNQLVDVGGRPTLVDVGQSQPSISWVDANGGLKAWACRLAAGATTDAQLLGSSSDTRVFAAVPATGTLVTTDESGATCHAAVSVGDQDSKFGPLVQSSHYVFVANRKNGTTYVIDLNQPDIVLTQFKLTADGNNLELTERDGLVFYNDLDSEVAGVLSFRDGSWAQGKALQKYNPQNPSDDVATPSSSAASAPISTDQAETKADSSSQDATTAEDTTDPSSAQTTSTSAVPAVTTSARVTTSGRPRNTSSQSSSASSSSESSSSTSSSTTTSSSAPLEPPVITDFTLTPVVGVEQDLALTATVVNTADARWQLTLTAVNCSSVITLPDAPISLEQQMSGLLSVTIPAQDWACLGSYNAVLAVTNPAGSTSTDPPVTIQVSSDPSTTPSISGLSCSPVNPLAADPISCTATETVVGSRGSWSWEVVDHATSAPVLNLLTQLPNVDFVPTPLDPGDYDVKLTVSYRGESASNSTELRFTVVVPDLLGLTLDDANGSLTAAGFEPQPSYAPSHSTTGTVIVAPEHDYSNLYGTPVQFVVSTGPNPTVHITDVASAGSWFSWGPSEAPQSIPWNGDPGDTRGFVRMVWANVETSGAHMCMETQPKWVDNSTIQGWVSLPNPPILGDHFKVDLGFMQPTASQFGGGTFEVSALMSNGTSVTTLLTQSDTEADGVIRSFDIDLSPVAGARDLIFTFYSGASSAQDWACWIDPRIE